MEKAKTSEVSRFAVFDELTDDDLKKIVGQGRKVHLPKDWSLIWEKTPADKAYILLDGEVVVRRGKQDVARLGPGAVIGETAIVNHKLRNASVVTTTEVDVLHFTRESVEQLCRDIPTFNRALETAASGDLGDPTES